MYYDNRNSTRWEYPDRYMQKRHKMYPNQCKLENVPDVSMVLNAIPDIGWPSNVVTTKLLSDRKANTEPFQNLRHGRKEIFKEERRKSIRLKEEI